VDRGADNMPKHWYSTRKLAPEMSFNDVLFSFGSRKKSGTHCWDVDLRSDQKKRAQETFWDFGASFFDFDPTLPSFSAPIKSIK